MANLISRHPDLALHLSDRTLTPLVTSARDQQQHDALASLSHAALYAHQTAQRLGFGKPKRIIVEHNNGGPLILQTFIAPEHHGRQQLPLQSSGQDLETPQQGGGPGSRSPNGHSNNHTAVPSSRGTSTPVAGASTNGGALPLDSPGSGISPRQTHKNAGSGDFGDYIQHGGDFSGVNDLILSMPGLLSLEDDDELDDEEDANAPPMLLSIVVAGSAESTSNARRAAAGLERVGRMVQSRWTDG